MDIKELYRELIDNWNKYHNPRKYEVPRWHAKYRQFYNQVAKIRSQLKNGYRLDAQRDREFLGKLILASHSGISDAGRSRLSQKNFEALIEKPEFLRALEILIKDPNVDNFENFGDTWRRCKNQHSHDNPLRVNRVVAACTDGVSSTVDIPKFEEVFKKLISKGHIAPYNEPNASNSSIERNWFEKNQHLMRELHKKFETELKGDKTHSIPIYLSIFVWELYLHPEAWTQNYANQSNLS